MNNEEKILAILEEHSKQFQQINGRLDRLTGDMTDVKGRLDKLETDVSQIKEDVAEVKTEVKYIGEDVSRIGLRLGDQEKITAQLIG